MTILFSLSNKYLINASYEPVKQINNIVFSLKLYLEGQHYISIKLENNHNITQTVPEMQLETEVLPSTALDDPSGQGLQALCPISSWYVLSAHG